MRTLLLSLATLLLLSPALSNEQAGVPGGSTFIRGDVNADGVVDISDCYSLGSYNENGYPVPECEDAADVDDDGDVDPADLSYLTTYLYGQGTQPPAPFPSCDYEETCEDTLECTSHTYCDS